MYIPQNLKFALIKVCNLTKKINEKTNKDDFT